MSELMNLPASVLGAAVAVLSFCSCWQVVHGYIRMMYRSRATRTSTIVYESALFAHMCIVTVFLFDAYSSVRGFAVVQLAEEAIAEPLLWANGAIAAVALFAPAFGSGSSWDEGKEPEHLWMNYIEALLAACFIPPLIDLIGDAWILVLAIDVLYYVLRTVFLINEDNRVLRSVVSFFSITEAVKKLPDGLLYADKRGRTIVLNDAMSNCLEHLGMSGEARNADALWDSLLNRASAITESVDQIGSKDEAGETLVVHADTDDFVMFRRDIADFSSDESELEDAIPGRPHKSAADARQKLGAVPHSRIISSDVTAEIDLARKISEANKALAASQDDLLASVAAVRAVAEDEALLRMRARVHDVIGQRLSMLHRLLEDKTISDEEISKIKPLLNGIIADLSNQDDVPPEDDLAATVDAFKLAGVEISIEGSLPDDSQWAELYASVIREAATNAVKHAKARTVHAVMEAGSLVVSNDGAVSQGPIEEGSGLSSIRARAQAQGAALSTRVEDGVFTLEISLPS